MDCWQTWIKLLPFHVAFSFDFSLLRLLSTFSAPEDDLRDLNHRTKSPLLLLTPSNRQALYSEVANAWEELSFDYSTINTSNQYQRLVLIFDLGTMGDGTANFTYLFDDIRLTNSVVPVKMVSFKATVVNNNALVKWITETELNNDHYEIERSNDGVHFTARGRVNGNGTSSVSHTYEFTDQLNAAAAIVYYRLKLVDADGRFSYSSIVALRTNGSASIGNVSVYPNPFISNIKVALTSKETAIAGFRILSFEGKEILNRNMSVQQGDNIIVLNDVGILPKGLYVLEVTTASGKIIKKIEKN